MEESDADELMQDIANMLSNVGVACPDIHEEANMVRKVLLVCGGDKAMVRAKVI